MRVPSNIIKSDLYTSGNEFVNANTKIFYQGYYYELNGKFYAGDNFDVNAPEIIKKEQIDSLLKNNNTTIFSTISGITSKTISNIPIQGINLGEGGADLSHGNEPVFFCKYSNVTPILIKAIEEKTYLSLQGKPQYQTIFIGTYRGFTIDPNQAEIQMIGLKEFLENA
jgi:hypothetical protein